MDSPPSPFMTFAPTRLTSLPIHHNSSREFGHEGKEELYQTRNDACIVMAVTSFTALF